VSTSQSDEVDEIEMGRVLAHVYGGDSGDRVDGRLLAVMIISTASLFLPRVATTGHVLLTRGRQSIHVNGSLDSPNTHDTSLVAVHTPSLLGWEPPIPNPVLPGSALYNTRHHSRHVLE